MRMFTYEIEVFYPWRSVIRHNGIERVDGDLFVWCGRIHIVISGQNKG